MRGYGTRPRPFAIPSAVLPANSHVKHFVLLYSVVLCVSVLYLELSSSRSHGFARSLLCVRLRVCLLKNKPTLKRKNAKETALQTGLFCPDVLPYLVLNHVPSSYLPLSSAFSLSSYLLPCFTLPNPIQPQIQLCY